MAWMVAGKAWARLTSVSVFSRRLLVGVVLGYALISLTLGGTPAARGSFYAAVALWSGLSLASMLWPGRRKAANQCRRSGLLRALELVCVNMALTLVLAEGGLRLAGFCSGNSLMLSDALESYRLIPGRDYGHGLRGNSLGFPGTDFVRDKSPGMCRIAALGDSFAVGPAVPFANNYLTLLGASRPDIEVLNFGVSGAGPREYQLILNQHVWTYQPDLVLVSVFVGNDVTEWLATPHEMDPRQSAFYLLVTRGWRVWREQSRNGKGNGTSSPDRLAGSGLSPAAFREVEARRLAICFKTPPTGLEKKWQRALDYLERLIRDCRKHQAAVAFVLIPDEFQVNPQVLSEALADLQMERTEVDLPLPQRRLLAFFAEREVPCLDLLPAFAGQPRTYAPRDTHWNERGNRLAAHCIDEWLQVMCVKR